MKNTRENNFNIIRLSAALLVIYVHSFSIFNTTKKEPIVSFLHLGFGLGEFAVTVFFIISGYLITASYIKSGTNFQYFKARVLRIYPGLIVVMLLTAFLVGPFLTRLDIKSYFQSIEVYLYPIKGIPLFTATSFLPGLFTENHYPNAVNGSLWTLFWEFLCYIGVAVLGNLKILNKLTVQLMMACVIVTSVILSFFSKDQFIMHSLVIVLPLFLAFFTGMLFYFIKSNIKFEIKWTCIVLISFIILSNENLSFTNLYLLPLAYLVFALSYSKHIRFYHFGSKYDISYGTYIYAFLIQQILYQVTEGSLPFFVNVTLSIVITIPFAFLSYVLIEKPIMKFK